MRLTPSVILKIVLIVVVVFAAAFVLFLPRTEFFQGALMQTRQIQTREAPSEPAAIVLHYIKDESEKEVKIGSKNVHLFSADLNIKNEPVEITGLTVEIEGEASLSNLECIVNNTLISAAEFTYLNSNQLLVDLSGNPQTIEGEGRIEILGTVVNAKSGQILRMHLADISATGELTGENITNVGINNEAYPEPRTIRFL